MKYQGVEVGADGYGSSSGDEGEMQLRKPLPALALAFSSEDNNDNNDANDANDDAIVDHDQQFSEIPLASSPVSNGSAMPQRRREDSSFSQQHYNSPKNSDKSGSSVNHRATDEEIQIEVQENDETYTSSKSRRTGKVKVKGKPKNKNNKGHGKKRAIKQRSGSGGKIIKAKEYSYPVKLRLRRIWNNPIVQKLTSLLGSVMIIILIKKLLRPSVLKQFFIWMEHHPLQGLLAYLIIYPLHMVLLLPGTPLVMGAGFVFKVQYGWTAGVLFCSLVTLFGSLVGSILCFLLARYCMRSAVRRWSKKYPLFDPIDLAVSDNGFKIMTLIYLTPVVPLGPISYMMGTTSMPLVAFAKAKIAALPFTVLYVYLGAATGTLMLEEGFDFVAGDGDGIGTTNKDVNANSNNGMSNVDTSGNGNGNGVLHKVEEISLSPKLIIAGILFSMGSITLISIKMKKELQKILDGQSGKKRHEAGVSSGSGDVNVCEESEQQYKPNKTRQRKAANKTNIKAVDDAALL